jgi:hypothetical protein
VIKLLDILKEIKWLAKSYELASTDYFPLTPNIANILNKGKTVKSFHITSFDKLNQLKSLEGTKKSISTLTRSKNKRLYRDLKSHWNDGVLCYLEGILMIKSKSDIMSRPDDTGRRWINFGAPGNTTSDFKLHNKFKNFISKEIGSLKDEIYNANLKKDFSEEMNTKRNIFLKQYINLATKFTQENAEEILTSVFGERLYDDELSDTDEIIVNNIKLLDCVYSDKATPEEIKTINQTFPGEKIPVSIGTEDVYNIVNKFVADRVETEV